MSARPRSLPQASREGEESLSFPKLFERQQGANGKRSKGQRTRDRLTLAAVKLLNEAGFNDMRVADICAAAGVSTATFYLYFKDRTDIASDVLSGFLDTLFSAPTPAPAEAKAPRTPFESILAANLRWVVAARENAGLLRCVLQMSDQMPAFADLYERVNARWYRQIAISTARRHPEFAVSEDVLLLAAYALGGMMDEIARRLLVTRDTHLALLTKSVAPTDQDLAEFMSVLWYRALYGETPAGVKTDAAKALAGIRARPPA